MKKIEMEKIDWNQVHRDMVLNDYGMNIEFYEDGSHALLSSGSYTQDAVATMKTTGRGDRNDEYYLAGWGTLDDYTGMFHADDGRVLTLEEAVEACVEEGEQHELYEGWMENVNNILKV